MGNSFLLIVVGLLLFYLVISDKWKCVEGFAACVTGKTNAAPSTGASPTSFPQTPKPPGTTGITLPTTTTLALNSNWLSGNLSNYGF